MDVGNPMKLDFSLECIQLLQNDFFKQRYITLNAAISGQDRIYPNTDLCRTFFAGYIFVLTSHRWEERTQMETRCRFGTGLLPESSNPAISLKK